MNLNSDFVLDVQHNFYCVHASIIQQMSKVDIAISVFLCDSRTLHHGWNNSEASHFDFHSYPVKKMFFLYSSSYFNDSLRLPSWEMRESFWNLSTYSGMDY